MYQIFIQIILTLVICTTTISRVTAQTVQESWLRQAGITCGGGLSVDVEGSIEATVLRRLKIAGGAAEGSYNAAELELLLKQFQTTEKSKVYSNYIGCLLTVMRMATNASDLPPREVVLKSPIAVDPLEIVKRGQRILMAPGNSIAVGTMATIFTVNSIYNGRLTYRWSNSNTGVQKAGRNNYVSTGEIVKITGKCNLVPYNINEKDQRASFLVNC